MPTAKSSKNRFSLYFIIFSCISTAIIAILWGISYHFANQIQPREVDGATQLTVILDPGHGGEDGGAVGVGGICEKELNLAISEALAQKLSDRGVRVICTRREDVLLYDKTVNYQGRKKVLDLATRLKISRETENSIFVSIHMNSFSQSQYHGLQVYYSPNHEASRVLAQAIQKEVREELQPDNRRPIKTATSSIYLMNRITTPAVLVECGFLSNPEECARLADKTYQNALADQLADAIEEFAEQYP